MENLPLPTSLVNCGLTSHMCDICGKKGKIFYIKSYIELSFHISSVLGNYLVYYIIHKDRERLEPAWFVVYEALTQL